MKIINRINKPVITIKTYRAGDPVYTAHENYEWLHIGK